MEYVCDAGRQKTWFRIETEAEAALESQLMAHAVEKHFRRAYEAAGQTYTPPAVHYVEQNIGREAYIKRTMPVFLTLRDDVGKALVTAMIPRREPGRPAPNPVIVGPANSDPYPEHVDAIEDLARHFGRTLDRLQCYPYRRV